MKNSINKILRREKLTKGYFNAPIPDLINFEYGKNICGCCNQQKSRFIIPPWGEFERICIECLQTSKLKFTHESDFGPVTIEEYPMPDELKIELGSLKDHVTIDQIKILLSTPNFNSIHDGAWKIHCKDFMDFIGIWQPCDFTNREENGNGKKLFMQMTDGAHHIWNEMKDDETEDTWDDIKYYSFECRKCKKLLGYWE